MQERLPADPRCFATTSDDPLIALAQAWQDAAAAAQREAPPAALVGRLRQALERGLDEEIAGALAQATSPAVYRCLARSLDDAANRAPPGAGGVALQLFAIPLLVVTGGRTGAVVSGVLSDVERVRGVLQESGALGPLRSFGLGGALCDLHALQRVPASRIHALRSGGDAFSISDLQLPPADMRAASEDEEVHLRFLVGASVSAPNAPSFLETSSAIATWGMALTRELAAQLQADGATVLPIPRPPATLFAAQSAGCIAREELSLQAFVSRELRRFRAQVGEPEAALAALDSGNLGLRFVSPFVEKHVAVHRRALHPSEELREVVDGVLGLLAQCRVARVEVLPGIVADATFAEHPASAARH